jgi:hypothetical protein
MSDKLRVRSGYVYCVRRSGKTYYKIGNAPAGQLVDHLKKFAQTEDNPTTLVLVGWIEVEDHVLAAKTLRETFHLYRLQDHWFDFRVTRSSEMKSFLGSCADLMVKPPVAGSLIIHEPQPQYDRSFGFFEALHAANHCAYFPPETSGIPVFPLPEKHRLMKRLFRSATKISQTLFKPSPWTYGLGAAGLGAVGLGVVAIGLSSIYSLQASQSPHSTPHSSTTRLPSSKPSTPPNSQPPAPPKTTESKPTTPKSTTPKPTESKPTTPKLTAPKPTESKPTESTPPDSQQPMVWSTFSEGARLRSSPDSSGDEIDFIPNGTPIILGEVSGVWQEVTLPNGQRGWVFNDLVQN